MFRVYKPTNLKEIAIDILPRWVGKQFIDNTSSDERMLDSYFLTDLRLAYKWESTSNGRFVSFNFLIRNILNEMYSANAWSYRYSSMGSFQNMLGYYPQAGINYMVGLTLGF